MTDTLTLFGPKIIAMKSCPFIRGGLRDLSVSRTSFSWGIPVPSKAAGQDKHVIYVWIDALTNYISALGGTEGELYKKYWPGTHIIGKDILRFHAVYWPCILLALGEPLPKSIYVHGWWTVRGDKISKSLPATRVDPMQLSEDLGRDAVRYFLFREIPFGPDGDFTYKNLIGRYNADLANDLGNLVNRTITMASKFATDFPPQMDLPTNAPTENPENPENPENNPGGTENPHRQIWNLAEECARAAKQHWQDFAIARALQETWKFIAATNRYIDATQPWKLAKQAAQPDVSASKQLRHVLYTLLASLTHIAKMIAPLMPDTAMAILQATTMDTSTKTNTKASPLLQSWPKASLAEYTVPTTPPPKPSPIFPRIDDKQATELMAKWMGPDAPEQQVAPAKKNKSSNKKSAKGKTPLPPPGTIGFEDFQRMDLRYAVVTTAAAIAGTEKLLELSVDVGEAKERTIVAGIAQKYSPQELIGKGVIVLTNLAPRKIRGVTSHGMVLAAGEKEILGLLSAHSADDTQLPPGTPIG